MTNIEKAKGISYTKTEIKEKEETHMKKIEASTLVGVHTGNLINKRKNVETINLCFIWRIQIKHGDIVFFVWKKE